MPDQQNKIYNQAIILARNAEANSLLFDPQGHLIYTITIGTTTTLCSIDITSDKIPQQIKNQYKTIYGKNALTEIPSSQRTSVVPLFEETNAHMTLMANTYQNHLTELQQSVDWPTIHRNAAQKIQTQVARIYKTAVEKSKLDLTVNVEKLNSYLVSQRADLAGFAKRAVFQELFTQINDRGKILQCINNLSNLDKHAFTEETATGFDYFYTSDHLKQGMLITGTADTAHNKKKYAGNENADQAAYRQITYTYMDADSTFQSTGKTSARMPSPALVFNGMTDDDIIQDLTLKYAFLYDKMQEMRGNKSGPAVENLFTSFNSDLYERVADSKNLQRKSALLMIQAMHKFNATRLETDNNFIYIQNIGTNRHTGDLGYQDDRWFGGSTELDDITLSAEMAMLHSMSENISQFEPDNQAKITKINSQVIEKYKKYLGSNNREKYFAESLAGKELIQKIREFKKSIQAPTTEDQTKNKDLSSLSSRALLKMFANNQHWNKRFGQLVQSLSIYIQPASVGGCKSGNERNQDVMARCALLTSINSRFNDNVELDPSETQVQSQLQDYLKTTATSPDNLRAALSTCVAKVNLHGGVDAISREDQGGAAKISSFSFVQNIENPFLRYTALLFAVIILPIILIASFIPLGFLYSRFTGKKWFAPLLDLFNTNNAADREMRLDAGGASKTQAHKGQDKKTLAAAVEEFNIKFPTEKLSQLEKSSLKTKTQEVSNTVAPSNNQAGSEHNILDLLAANPNHVQEEPLVTKNESTNTATFTDQNIKSGIYEENITSGNDVEGPHH